MALKGVFFVLIDSDGVGVDDVLARIFATHWFHWVMLGTGGRASLPGNIDVHSNTTSTLDIVQHDVNDTLTYVGQTAVLYICYHVRPFKFGICCNTK